MRWRGYEAPADWPAGAPDKYKPRTEWVGREGNRDQNAADLGKQGLVIGLADPTVLPPWER